MTCPYSSFLEATWTLMSMKTSEWEQRISNSTYQPGDSSTAHFRVLRVQIALLEKFLQILVEKDNADIFVRLRGSVKASI